MGASFQYISYGCKYCGSIRKPCGYKTIKLRKRFNKCFRRIFNAKKIKAFCSQCRKMKDVPLNLT